MVFPNVTSAEQAVAVCHDNPGIQCQSASASLFVKHSHFFGLPNLRQKVLEKLPDVTVAIDSTRGDETRISIHGPLKSVAKADALIFKATRPLELYFSKARHPYQYFLDQDSLKPDDSINSRVRSAISISRSPHRGEPDPQQTRPHARIPAALSTQRPRR
jgi:hypothetical protein